jgi:hypothetical protein
MDIRMNVGDTWYKDVNWIELGQDRDQSRAFMNTLMILRIP